MRSSSAATSSPKERAILASTAMSSASWSKSKASSQSASVSSAAPTAPGVHRVEQRREPLQRRIDDRLDAADRVIAGDERFRRHLQHDVGLTLGVASHGPASQASPTVTPILPDRRNFFSTLVGVHQVVMAARLSGRGAHDFGTERLCGWISSETCLSPSEWSHRTLLTAVCLRTTGSIASASTRSASLVE